VTDQETIAAAILTALNTALPSGADAYEIDGVPGTLGNLGSVPAKSVVISLSRNWTDSYRFGGANSVPGFFLKTTYRAPNVQSCRELRRLVSAALEDQPVGAYGPFTFNQEERPIDDDPDWGFSGTDAWSFC